MKDTIMYKIRQINWLLLINVLFLIVIGLMIQYSSAGGRWHYFALHQLGIFFTILPFIVIASLLNINFYIKISYIFYITTIFLLLGVSIFGTSVMGATRWIRFAGFNFQPSEITKIALILSLSRYFYEKNIYQIVKFKTIMVAVIIAAPAIILVLKQPNLGTASVLCFITVSTIFVVVIKSSQLLVFSLIGVSCVPIIWNFLHSYQKRRIFSFLNPDFDPLGMGYNMLQSQIAIGSGGMFGKGFVKGTQTQLSFLPEKQTDFVFTVLSEEWGFIGVLVLFFTYSLLVFNSLFIAYRSNHYFCKLVAMGIASFFSVHFFINIGMVIGFLPIVGVPLPFLSYGGSIMLSSMLAVGILFAIHRHSINDKKFFHSEIL